jgi:superfamily II DNA helicase RecQ
MSNLTPSPPSMSLIPHHVSRDPPFDGDDNHPLPIIPDASIGNRTTAATTAGAATAGGCNDDRLKACIVAASMSVLDVPDMFPAQLVAVFCLLHPMKPNHLAVVERTGAGKTHILWMLGVIKQGIILIFIPLLTLLADVMSKFTCANHHFGTVIIQHLDELFDANKSAYKDLLERCQGLCCSTTTTVFLFLSPQFLINHSDAREIFIKCSHCTTLRVFALDEAHIHVQHGTSFHSEICTLKALFFSKIFGNRPAMIRPRLVALTVTMPDSYLPLLSQLLTISSFSRDSLICGSSIDFSQCQIEMRSYITSNKGQYVSKGLSLVAKFLQENPSLSAVVFCNSCKQSQHFHDHLE